MRSNALYYYSTILLLFLLSFIILSRGIYGVYNYEHIYYNNHGNYIQATLNEYIPAVIYGCIIAIFLLIILLKYRRVELSEQGVTILYLFTKRNIIAWEDVQFLRRVNWPLPDKVIFKITPKEKSSFYFRTNYPYPFWTILPKREKLYSLFASDGKYEITEMEKFITSKKSQFNIKNERIIL